MDQQIAACNELLGRSRLRPDIRSNAYNNRGFALLQQNKLDLALADFAAALEINPRNLTARFNRYSTFVKKGNLAGALADLQIVVALQQPARTAQQYIIQSKNLVSIGQMQHDLNHYPDAVKSYEAAIAIGTRYAGPDAPFVLSVERDLGQVLMEMTRLDEAETLLRNVVAKTEQVEGAESATLARTLDLLGLVLTQKARFGDAQTTLGHALAVYQKATGAESGEAAMVLLDLGTNYALQSRFDDGLKAYLQALAIREKTSGPESVDTAKVLGNLALTYQDMGRYRDAEAYGLRTLNLFTKLAGPDSPEVALALGNLANFYSDQRRMNESIASRKRALAIYETTFGPQAQEVGLQLSNLGIELTDMGRAAEAEPVFARALTIFERNLGPDHPVIARTLNNLSRVYYAEQRNSEAAEVLGRALSIQEKVSGPNSPEMAAPLVNLARAERRLGHVDRAVELLQRASGVAREADFLLRSNIAHNKALVAEDRRQWSEAEADWREQLTILDRAFGPDYPASAEVYGRLGALAEKRNDLDGAIAFVRKGAAIVAKREQSSAPDVESGWLYTNLAANAWGVAANHPEQAPKLAEESFAATQQTQLGKAGAAVAQMAARFGAGSSDVATAVREQQDLAAQSEAFDTKLNAALGSAKQDSEALANLRAQISSLEARLEDTRTRIARDFPQYAELSRPKPLTLAETKALLRTDEALVTWLVDDDAIFIFALTHDGSDWRRVAMPEKQLNATVAKLRAGLDLNTVSRGLARGDAGRDIVFSLADAYALYQQLLEPVQALVGPKTNLVVVPAGALTSLPLQVLVTEAPKRAASSVSDSAFLQAAWLPKSHAITVLPSVASLRALRAFAKPTGATQPLVGFADPVFGRGPDGKATRGGTTRVSDVGSYARYFRGGAVDVDALRNGLPALPETADELRAVAGQLHAPSSDLKFGEQATVSEVKALPLDRFRVVYFATHGLVAGDVQGLTEPALALTIPTHPTPADSGLLTASDVAQLKLDADWVVLSACNTASGDKPGADGLSGLARAFFYAGARALLVSHWPVQSAAAVQVTTRTFAAMASDPKLDRAEALRRSELALIATGGDNAYPAVWAPFVVVGEGGSGR